MAEADTAKATPYIRWLEVCLPTLQIRPRGLIRMKIVYTAEPIQEEHHGGHVAIQGRVAKVKLEALIQESLRPMGLVTSYSIAEDDEFPFPEEMPNIFELKDFFGENPDYNLVKKELEDLYKGKHSKRKHAEFMARLNVDLETATDEQMLEMVKKRHYRSKQRPYADCAGDYDWAVEKLRTLWKPYDELGKSFEKPEYNEDREIIEAALKSLNNEAAQRLVSDVAVIRTLLSEGKRDKAKKRIKKDFSDWKRKRLDGLADACGNEMAYNDGFWIARLVTPESELKVREMDFSADCYLFGRTERPRTLEEALDILNMPYQAVQL